MLQGCYEDTASVEFQLNWTEHPHWRYLVSSRIRPDGVLDSQQDAAENDEDKDEVAPVRVDAELVAQDTEPVVVGVEI